MKTFKQFLESVYGIGAAKDANGRPCALIDWQRGMKEGWEPDDGPSSLNHLYGGHQAKSSTPAFHAEPHEPSEGQKKRQSFDDWSFHNHNDHLGHTENEVAAHLAKNTHFSEPELHQVRHYTLSSYDLNKKLYTAHMDGHEAPTHVDTGFDNGESHDVHLLHRMTHRPLTHDLHVHTGINFNAGHYAEEHDEGHVHLPAFTSTSINGGTAHQFSRNVKGVDGEKQRHVLHIHLKPGDHGVYVGHKSASASEKEFLLPRQTTLKVDHQNPTIHQDYHGNKVHIWHATVAHQEPPKPE